MIPIAMYNAVSLGIEGIHIAHPHVRLCKNHFKIKETPITITNAMIKASIFRMPLLIKNNNRKVSNTVIITPSISGMPNNDLYHRHS
jgi:hypothetical protein